MTVDDEFARLAVSEVKLEQDELIESLRVVRGEIARFQSELHKSDLRT